MIPSVLAQHVEQGIKDFLRTTFPVTTPFFSHIVEQLLNDPDNVFKGPYLDIQLPFQQGKGGADFFPELSMPFRPYLHQEKSFERLSSPNPKSTLVATGTGSGKTECFLYPILDYCYQHRGEPGIKAILIYPMNALATDQAGRLAGVIYNSKLKGHVTAGLYVGQQEKEPAMLMGPDRLISDKNTMRLSPPDILLTNYKMLDYLLIRPQDRPIWQQNSAETLRFLVVDELHTFDGAQGSDLGCLIRRLKSRLAVSPDHLCGIGTSATLGSDEDKQELIEYASQVFGETFDKTAVISENRLSAGEFLGDSLISHVNIIPVEKAEELVPGKYDTYEAYIHAQVELWFDKGVEGEFHDSQWRLDLGEELKKHLLFQNLLKVLAGKICGFEHIFIRLEKVTKGLKETSPQYRVNMLNSLLSLISEARVHVVSKKEDGREETLFMPFLNVRLQLWMRELRRMVASVGKTPVLRFADDLNEEQLKTHLPLVHCRECGSMGWSGLKRKIDTQIRVGLQDYYRCFFNRDPQVVYLFPEERQPGGPVIKSNPAPAEHSRRPGIYYFCARCLNVSAKASLASCPVCENEELILVHMPDVRVMSGSRQYSHNDCPFCSSKNSLTLLGSRAASLTSVMIVQLYSSTYNDDKKLLTFSDNVQDAAHRAGFFNGRTYRFNFRTALQKVILDGGDQKTLHELPKIFTAYWLERLGQNRYIATFLAPNMEWLSDYETLKESGTLKEDSNLLQLIHNRIGWEIISEYGFQTRIGRTLEKTGSSVIFLDSETLKSSVEKMLEPIKNEIGFLRGLDEKRLKTFILGLVVHLKNQGGIFQHYLSTFIEAMGNSFVLNKNVWMPNFGQFSRTPSFLTTKKGSRFDQVYSSQSTHLTWYQSWAEKCFFQVSPFVPGVSKELYDLVLKGLVNENILEQIITRGETVWGIKPEAMKVSSDVRQFRCKECEHNISVAREESESFIDAPCQRFHCYGKYKSMETGMDFYGKLYATGDVERIFAREHTGLLKRSEREELEQEFKASNDIRHPWYPNLLSCTPTLEMGIDIGSLSSVVLCSVPPAQANYLQRIGRAGRRDGNCLNLTIANARPHDLYFFAEPEKMLAGHIDSPGIFLDASAVLERQFTAFCFDRWVAADAAGLIPGKLGEVLNNLEPIDHKKFPHNFIHYIETYQADLFDRFLVLFKKGDAGLSPESEGSLKLFVFGDENETWFLRGRIMNGLHSRKIERESLKKKVRTLNTKISKKKKEPKDKNYADELRELSIEKSALQALVKSISDRDTFNFFTDEGLLPNYAFPEVGVMLNSIIYRKKAKVQEGERSYDTWSFEYERPARSAIDELAPANTFYAEGRKVTVDQVDMSVSEVEKWRFCNNCSHKQMLGVETEIDTCPCCGSILWADAGQKRFMLRMRQVFASTPDRKSRISDDSDDRDPTFYNKQMLVEFDDKQVLEAYKVDADFPFGFDFLSKVDFCEINFGEKTDIGEKISIAGIEMPRKGFAICRVCGKVQDEKNGESSHAFTCTARDQESDKNLIDCLYLYRQFMSEAIRILLPVSIISESERKLQSFIAAIQLGLKKRFKGKIDHLQTTVHEEPMTESSFKRKFLVLYDTVPGGTGYLKQLMRSEKELIKVLELALEALKSCTCNQEEGKDGCYRCLYAYRNSYNMPQTSRDTAIELLAEILLYRDRLVKTENIRNISMNTYIESELEARFIGALKKEGTKALPIQLKNDLVNGKPGYFLKVGDRAYYIEPQVKLGELSDVSIESRADFVIRPARLNDPVKPIAVFLDGYTYHRDRIGKDMAQRMAIVQSGKYQVWSLTWQDVENKFKPQNNFYTNFLDPTKLSSGGSYQKMLDGFGIIKMKNLITLNSFDLLIRFLENPDEKQWQKFMFVFTLMYADPGRFNTSEAIDAWSKTVEAMLPEEMAQMIMTIDCPCLYGDYLLADPNGNKIFKQSVAIEQKAVALPGNPLGIKVCGCLNDGSAEKENSSFHSDWNGFLRLYNFYQFLPYAYFVSTDGVNNKIYDSLKLYEEPILGTEGIPTEPYQAAWNEIKEFVDEIMHELLDKLKGNGWAVPEVGFELEGPGGDIVGCAEMGWPQLKLAFLTDEELTHQQHFISAGWKIVPIHEVLSDPDSYMNLKN